MHIFLSGKMEKLYINVDNLFHVNYVEYSVVYMYINIFLKTNKLFSLAEKVINKNNLAKIFNKKIIKIKWII